MRPEFYHMTEDIHIGNKDYSVGGLCILNTAKNRHGETKNTALNFKGSCMHFTDHYLDTENNFQQQPIYNNPYKDNDTDVPF